MYVSNTANLSQSQRKSKYTSQSRKPGKYEKADEGVPSHRFKGSLSSFLESTTCSGEEEARTAECTIDDGGSKETE